MLAEDLSDYLFARSTGHFASLRALINRGCLRAIRAGAEPEQGVDEHDEERRRRRSGPPSAGVGLITWSAQRIPLTVAPHPGEALDSWLERLRAPAARTRSICLITNSLGHDEMTCPASGASSRT
ncbi:hypothetical protein ACIQVR_37485 [Streptomyces xanthochromogenes]|uniref:hypothetical protein n=1 Tax=Streptomyces xanthochromogenes TaxID=67384 RepID=UPI003814F144